MSKEQNETIERVETRKPKMYQVYILNDDLTPVDFVEQILNRIFRKSNDEAMEIIQTATNKGKALVGVYIRDVAVSRVRLAEVISKDNNFPLEFKIKED